MQHDSNDLEKTGNCVVSEQPYSRPGGDLERAHLEKLKNKLDNDSWFIWVTQPGDGKNLALGGPSRPHKYRINVMKNSPQVDSKQKIQQTGRHLQVALNFASFDVC